MILINTTAQKISVRQPLLATELFKAEVGHQQYCTEFNHEGDEITISFLPASLHEDVVIQWRWKKIQIHQKKLISQWNTQFVKRPYTGKAYDLKKK